MIIAAQIILAGMCLYCPRVQFFRCRLSMTGKLVTSNRAHALRGKRKAVFENNYFST